ncbi:hypothetical protein HDU87_008466 [Geranomyces variabilis]|uniref:HIT domain-containing protein n=1 Tax=Geranomyces variabilis TaxID=109894 RepID=A0AAD5TQT9_9FUNG|nr:hypothetical protein HDU87_008466 [Geranomyces variabilis]
MALDVLVLPRRVVQRFADLSREEVADLFLSAHTIAKKVETQYKAESLTITIQDGVQAGQTVPHVHVHLIPRRTGDWADNNDIYPEIDEKERELAQTLKQQSQTTTTTPIKKKFVDDENRQQRTPEDMASEAKVLRALFEQSEDIWSV